MIRTLTHLQDKIKHQEEEIKYLKNELKIGKQIMDEDEEEKDRLMQICMSCQKCQWRV